MSRQTVKKQNSLQTALLAGLVCICISCNSNSNNAGYEFVAVSNDGGKWGYINDKGEYVINPQFEDANLFSDDLAKIKSGGGKTGYVNKRGEYVIPAIYKNGTSFSDGLAFVVAEGGLPTCIDNSGNTKFILNEAKYVSAFSEGLAIFVTEAGEYGFVDKNGTIAINAQFDRAMPFNGGYARIWQKNDVGFIDKTGKIAVNPQFRGLENFSEGVAAFSNGSSWGYINEKGVYVINPMFEYCGDFKNGIAAIKQGRSFGYIDKAGKLFINPQFDVAFAFSEGLAAVENGGKYGYINKEGKYEINPQFHTALAFKNGIALVQSSDKWGLINKKGQYVVNPQFKNVKLEMQEKAQLSLIESDYYDTSEFIRLFFEREAGNTFDGVNATNTLEKLSEHPVYGSDLNARAGNYADSHVTIPVTKDIYITNVTFRFLTKSVYKYNDWGGRAGLDFTATPDAIVYHFQFNGKASEKRHVILSALKSEIERRHGQSMLQGSENDSYYLTQPDGKLNFVITGNELTVAFTQMYFINNQYVPGE